VEEKGGVGWDKVRGGGVTYGEEEWWETGVTYSLTSVRSQQAVLSALVASRFSLGEEGPPGGTPCTIERSGNANIGQVNDAPRVPGSLRPSRIGD